MVCLDHESSVVRVFLGIVEGSLGGGDVRG